MKRYLVFVGVNKHGADKYIGRFKNREEANSEASKYLSKNVGFMSWSPSCYEIKDLFNPTVFLSLKRIQFEFVGITRVTGGF